MLVRFFDGSEREIANLQRANLQRANLQRANLQRADLWGANLRGADLWGADLWGANLSGADLRSTDLQRANLRRANLRRADLWGANLRGADLRGADLWGADLSGADLWGADLSGADLRGARGYPIAWRVYYVSDILKLVKYDSITRIYVNDMEFMSCSYLLISVPTTEANNDFDSIDEFASIYGRAHEADKSLIDANSEFWGHCSNLQAWYEHDYDTRLLHSNLSFPLLRKLADVGDATAKRAFKDEIARRWESGYEPVRQFLEEEGYLTYFTAEERKSLGTIK